MYISRIRDNISEQYFAFFQAFPPPVADLAAAVWPSCACGARELQNNEQHFCSMYVYKLLHLQPE